MEPRESEYIDHLVAGVSVAIYFALAILFLPSSEYVRAIGSGLVVFSIVFLVAWKFGRRIQSGFSVMAVAFVATVALWMPTFPAMGGASDRAVPIGFLGVQAAALLWAAFWWQGPRGEPSHISLQSALRYGFLMAIGISAVAAIPVLLILLSGGRASWAILLVFPAYFAGFLLAAIVFWALQRIDNLAVGRYLIGMLGGICVYGAVGPAVAIFDHRAFDFHEDIMLALIAGGFVGPVLALNSYEIPKARLAKRSREKAR